MTLFSTENASLFKTGADRVQMIAKKVLTTVLPSQPKEGKSAPLQEVNYVSPTEKLNQLVTIHNIFCQLLEAPDVFAVKANREGKVIEISPSVEHSLGYKPGQLIGLNGTALLHPEDLKVALKNRKNRGVQIRCKGSDGEWQWMRCFLLSTPSGDHDYYFILAATIDLIEQEIASTIESTLNKWRGLLGLQSTMNRKDWIAGLEEIALAMQNHVDDVKKENSFLAI